MLNMLVVEDNIYFSKLLINKTIQFNKNLRLSMIATDGKEVLEIINREKIDIILLDMNIPGYNGLEILNFLARNKKEEYYESKNGEALSTIYSIMLPSCILFMQRRS